MKMEFIKTKTILNKVNDGSFWFGIDYNMNLYKGCSHGCIYCDSRSQCYHVDDFDRVRSKENALQILETELMRKRNKGVIGIGAMSDTYNPYEAKYKITRKALKLIEKYDFGVSIDTKSDLILRDIDILKKINKKNNVIIKLTITTPHDDLSKIIEPNVCQSAKRFAAIKQLSDHGLFVGILMMPVLPFISDKEEDIIDFVKCAHQSGAKFIYTYLGVTLRENQRTYYYQKLDQNFKGLKKKYEQFYGMKYQCFVPEHKRLFEIFKKECQKYNILYDMNDIIKAYKKERKSNEQLSLF